MRYWAIAAVAFVPAIAAADIRMTESRYDNGVLRVEGRTTQPRQEVTLDGIYRQVSCCRFSGRLVKLIPPSVRTQPG